VSLEFKENGNNLQIIVTEKVEQTS